MPWASNRDSVIWGNIHVTYNDRVGTSLMGRWYLIYPELYQPAHDTST